MKKSIHDQRIILAFSRKGLQIAVALGGCVPVLAGLAGVVWGTAMVENSLSPSISLDSHFHYLSGLLLGIGICFWSTIPHIEKEKRVFRMLTTIVFIGGLGRLYALFETGLPDGGMRFGLLMELVITPLLALWQTKISALEN